MGIFLSAIAAGFLSLQANLAPHLPYGIMHAPGIEMRIQDGKGLPPGIAKKFPPAPTSTPDTQVPIISGISVSAVSAHTAKISWMTNEKASAKVYVSTSVNPKGDVNAKIIADANLTMDHALQVNGLASDTTYFYVIEATDASGNVGVSSVASFATLHEDVNAPRIVGMAVVSVTKDSARIVWATDEKTDSKLWISTSTPVVTTGPATASSTSLGFFHDLTVTGLASSTVYHAIAGSADASGNMTTSAEASFTTLAQ